jgi:glycine/D-amino acid oxidase-like deaminating enzyme
MSHVVIIGCGIVGATIAYELSLVKGLKITVLDKQAPAQASTGAALGVLMGVISHKVKGKAWKLRQTSIQRYETLVPELESLTGRKISFNRQGILLLLPNLDENSAPEVDEQVTKENWEKLLEIRQSQGWHLEIWDIPKLKNICPQVDENNIVGAVYSPQDRQLDPTALTLALVEAAQRNGVTFKFGVNVVEMSLIPEATDVVANLCQKIVTTQGEITADYFVMASGLGSTVLTTQLNQKLDIRPVLGQALQLHLGHPLGNSDFQPAITGNDVHIVPCGVGVGAITDYWVGATVEFPSGENEIPPDKELLDGIFKKAIAFCPELAEATVKRTWTGLRPRPEGRPAPVIEKLAGYDNVLLATGHYRNGVLLAPATAYAIREMIIG